MCGHRERHAALQVIRDAVLEGRPRPEILARLHQQASPRLGPWIPQRLSDAIGQLRQGVAGIDALPDVSPAEREKKRVLEMIEQGLAAGGTWTTIATTLNALTVKPPRGTMFTPVQIRLRYMRARGQKTFTLSSRRVGVQQSTT